MPRNSNPEKDKKKKKRAPVKQREDARRGRKKPCIFCKEKIDWIDYKDVDLLRRYVSDRGKIRARRVTGNCMQHQRDIATAIKTSRELALMPYSLRLVTSRGAGRSQRNEDDGDENETMSAPAAPKAPKSAPAVVEEVVEIEMVEVGGEGGEA